MDPLRMRLLVIEDNRQLVAKWVMEKGASEKVAELVSRNGKTYVQINDYTKLRKLFGDLKVQRGGVIGGHASILY